MQPSPRIPREESRKKEPQRDYGEFIDEYSSPRTPPPPPPREPDMPEDYEDYRRRSDPRHEQELWDSFEAARMKNSYRHSYEVTHPQLEPHFDRHFDYRYGSDDIDFDSREERAEPRFRRHRRSRRVRRGY